MRSANMTECVAIATKVLLEVSLCFSVHLRPMIFVIVDVMSSSSSSLSSLWPAFCSHAHTLYPTRLKYRRKSRTKVSVDSWNRYLAVLRRLSFVGFFDFCPILSVFLAFCTRTGSEIFCQQQKFLMPKHTQQGYIETSSIWVAHKLFSLFLFLPH